MDYLEAAQAEIGQCVVKAGKSFVVIKMQHTFLDEEHDVKITVKDVVKYYREEAASMSGCRTLAGQVGDWRPIDNLAKIVLGYFKTVNVSALKRDAEKVGMVFRG
jgi:hypothetical protein